jgi:hypothetical protein
VLIKLVHFDCSLSCSQVENGENGLHIWNIVVNIFSKKLQVVLQPNGMEGAYIWPSFLIGPCVHSKKSAGFIMSRNFFIRCARISFSRRTVLHGFRLSLNCTLACNVAGYI